MSDAPRVSVVLPCFNAASFIDASLLSLRSQTLSDLEIVAIDDGSTDATLSILQKHARADGRIRILRNQGNQGLIPTLNRGVAEARGELLARMDADDVAAARRIERQVQLLVQRPDIDVLGSAITFIGDRRRLHRRLPARCATPGGARFMALLATPMAHMTLLARSAVMRAHPYGATPDSLHTEDYELFSRMLGAGVRLANLDEPLVMVRLHPGAVSRFHEQVQIANFVTCSRRYLERMTDLRPSEPVHRVLVNRIDATVRPSDLEEGLRLLDQLEEEFRRREPGDGQEVERIATTQRVDILVQAARRGPSELRRAAARLARTYAGRLRSGAALRYLASKL